MSKSTLESTAVFIFALQSRVQTCQEFRSRTDRWSGRRDLLFLPSASGQAVVFFSQQPAVFDTQLQLAASFKAYRVVRLLKDDNLPTLGLCPVQSQHNVPLLIHKVRINQCRNLGMKVSNKQQLEQLIHN